MTEDSPGTGLLHHPPGGNTSFPCLKLIASRHLSTISCQLYGSTDLYTVNRPKVKYSALFILFADASRASASPATSPGVAAQSAQSAQSAPSPAAAAPPIWPVLGDCRCLFRAVCRARAGESCGLHPKRCVLFWSFCQMPGDGSFRERRLNLEAIVFFYVRFMASLGYGHSPFQGSSTTIVCGPRVLIGDHRVRCKDC